MYYLLKSSQRKSHKTMQTSMKERLESLRVFLLVALPHTYLRQICKLCNGATSQIKDELQSQGKGKVAAHEAPSCSSHMRPCQQHYTPHPIASRPPPSPPTPGCLPYLALAYLSKACCYEDFDLSWCQSCFNPSNKTEPAEEVKK